MEKLAGATMGISALLHAFGSGLHKIIIAVLTLAPAPVAYGMYGAVLADQPRWAKLSPRDRYWRLFKHAAVALFAAYFIAYVIGQTCPHDDDGYCFDDDWKAPSPAQSLANYARLCLLILGGMYWAYRRREQDHHPILD
jgi:hypothetical protein